MNSLIPKCVFLFGLVVTNLVIRPRYIKQYGRTKFRNTWWTRQDKLLFSAVSVGYVLIPLLYIFTPWLSFANYGIPVWVSASGLILLVGGNWLFWRSHCNLGSNWSPGLEVREDHQLVTQGVYQRIRHPMYAAIWLIVLSQAMLLPNAIAGFSGLIAFGLLYFLRINKEEAMMMEQFGTAYQDYARKTGRLMPRW